MLLRRVPSSSSPSKGLYNPKAFITHAASLDQAFAHCPRFPTAASRRSLGRVSVPVWLIVLSDQLPINALVGRYPTNQLIGRGPLPRRPTSRQDFGPACAGRHPVLAAVSRGCPRARGRFPRVTHPSATERHPEGCRPVRLACVRRAASVRSEPGSNSQFDLPPPQVLPEEAGVRLHGITAQGRPHAGSPAHKGRAPAGLPRQALKGDRLEPRAGPAPTVPAAPDRAFAPSSRHAHARAPHRRADLAPPPSDA